MSANEKQSEAWNGTEAAHYVDHADRHDRQLAPFTAALLAASAIKPNQAVLDIGCGCGTTTFAAARAGRSAVGVDISEPLLSVARERAGAWSVPNVEFQRSDAQTHQFPDAAFDLVISQFGLMFFDDPVGAFTNLRRALSPGGRIVFACWQTLEANEWLMEIARPVARHAGVPDLGGLAGGPGMFALKDRGEVARLLESAGFADIDVTPISPTIVLGGGGGLDESVDFVLGAGMARGLLGMVEPEKRAEVTAEVRASLADHFEAGTGVSLGTGAWLASATN